MLRIVEEKIRLVEEKFRKVERERAELERLRDMILSMKDGDVPTVEGGGGAFGGAESAANFGAEAFARQQIYAQVGEGGAGAQPTGSGATAAAGGMVNPYSTKPGGSQGDYTQGEPNELELPTNSAHLS